MEVIKVSPLSSEEIGEKQFVSDDGLMAIKKPSLPVFSDSCTKKDKFGVSHPKTPVICDISVEKGFVVSVRDEAGKIRFYQERHKKDMIGMFSFTLQPGTHTIEYLTFAEVHPKIVEPQTTEEES
jgi:hypothetical protein